MVDDGAMTDDERKGSTLFCYAIALAVRKLDDGNFTGLNSQTFLVQVEGQIEEGVKILDPEDRNTAGKHGRRLTAMVSSLIESHEADLARFPKPHLVWPPEE